MFPYVNALCLTWQPNTALACKFTRCLDGGMHGHTGKQKQKAQRAAYDDVSSLISFNMQHIISWLNG